MFDVRSAARMAPTCMIDALRDVGDVCAEDYASDLDQAAANRGRPQSPCALPGAAGRGYGNDRSWRVLARNAPYEPIDAEDMSWSRGPCWRWYGGCRALNHGG